MKAAELYRILRAELGPSLTERGFRKLKTSRLAFQRQREDTYQTIWFQVDTHGWDTHAGSQFFANFTVSGSSLAYDLDSQYSQRLNAFLTDAELAGARDFRDSVVARIPKPPASYFALLEAECNRLHPMQAAEMLAALRSQFEPEPIPYRRNQDFVLRYWLPSDVSWWSRLIAAVLPRALEQMESWSSAMRQSR